MATTTKKNTVTVELIAEKPTKTTVRFKENVESEYVAPEIGTLYIPKATLGKLGYKEGDTIVLSVSIK